MNKENFYTSLRKSDAVFGKSLSQRQLAGIDALLGALEGYPLPHAAHVLAEVYHETGGGMYPVKETVFPHSKDKNPTDAQVIARLDRAYAAGKLPWVTKPYWAGGWFGRGQIQLTHRDNYIKASALVGRGIAANPDLALVPEISAAVAAEGCRVGLFTGKKLSDYDGAEYDHFNARAIVNGDKKKNGAAVHLYAMAFEQALIAGGWRGVPIMPPDFEPVQDAPEKLPRKGIVAAVTGLVAAAVATIAKFWCSIPLISLMCGG